MNMDFPQPARHLAGKNHAFCLRAETSQSARSLKAPQASFGQ